MCTFAVAMELGRCFLTAADARPGNVVRKPLSMVVQRVFGVGLKSTVWRKAKQTDRESCASMLLHCGCLLALKGSELSK